LQCGKSLRYSTNINLSLRKRPNVHTVTLFGTTRHTTMEHQMLKANQKVRLRFIQMREEMFSISGLATLTSQHFGHSKIEIS